VSNRSNNSNRSYERDDYDLDDPNHVTNKDIEDKLQHVQLDEAKERYLIVKRKTNLCYYVMKLAEYGELYSFIEHTDRFEESMVRYILDQLLEGMKYLHSNGIVHRDIKPENLLINRKGRIIIADFSFATRLKETDGDGIF
jgi:serine/threonine protein kinase